MRVVLKTEHTVYSYIRCCAEWNSVLGSYLGSSVETSAESDDVLKIRFIFCKETRHAFTPSQDVRESFVIRQSHELITVRPSELCNEESYSVRMILDFVNSHFPTQEKEKGPKIVARIIHLVQNSTGSIPLPPNSVIDVQRCDGIKILHRVSDEEKKARLVRYFEDTRRGTCEICMDDFEVGLDASRLPCLHVFHGACIVKWLMINPNCPVCRYSLPPKLATWF